MKNFTSTLWQTASDTAKYNTVQFLAPRQTAFQAGRVVQVLLVL